MKTKLLPLLLASALGGSVQACSKDNEQQATAPQVAQTQTVIADAIYYNGAVYTLDDNNSWAQAVAVKDGKFLYVGDDEAALAYAGDNTQIQDMKGKMLMPGFHDVHIHALESGSDATHFSLDSQITRAEDYLDEIAYADRANPGTGWLIGYGHSLEVLRESERLPLALLDEVVSHRPVIIMESTSHSMWVNSKALIAAGFSANTPDPVGGVIGREESGEINGILIDNAGNIVMDLAMAQLPDAQQNDYLGLKEYTLPEFAKHGITSISDARAYWKAGHHQVWQKLADNDELTVRVSLALWAYPHASDESQLQSLKALYSNPGDSLLKVNQIKVYSDGIIHNTTAALLAPYHQDHLGLSPNTGLNYFTQARLEKYIRALEPMGFDFLIHAIGDRGVRESLNAIENAAGKQARHRLTHVEMINAKDLPRFQQLGVIADAQVAGDFTQPEHWHENIPLVGEERSDELVPIGSLSDAGATLTLSSDWSVSAFNPMIGLQNAVTRAPQAIDLATAIRAYTLNGAYTMRQETVTGSIEQGKFADFVILDRNLFDIAPSSIARTQVLTTVLEGEVIYQR